MRDDPGGKIEARVKSELDGTAYAASDLKFLSGGFTNFIYRATLERPLPDGVSAVAVKHGEGFSAFGRDYTTSRCHVEAEALRYLHKFPQAKSPEFAVGTCKQYHWNSETSTQIQEYVRDGVSLKDYAIEHYAAPTPESLKPQCEQLGRSLGEWLRSYHNWGQRPEQQEYRDILSKNKDMQSLKVVVNYKRLLQRADECPTILEDVRDVLQQVCDMAFTELEDESKWQVTHGDFWTGNVVLPNEPIKDGGQTPIRIVDWEVVQLGSQPLDIGQMMSELWELKLYKDIDASLWIMSGFAAGYGQMDTASAFRAILHVGVHLIGWGSTVPGWGTPEQNEEVLRVGKDVLLKAWRQDRAAFEGHALECVFGSA